MPANGWSRKTYYPEEKLQDEENYSNGLLIEKISYTEKGVVTAHKIWNNRLRLLVDKTVYPGLPRPNVVTGNCSLGNYIKVLPGIAAFIDAVFDKHDLLRSYEEFLNADSDDLNWQMTGKKMNFKRGRMDYRLRHVELTTNDISEIDATFSAIPVQGARYPEHLQNRIGK